MNVDKALVNSGVPRISEGGDTCRGRAERMGFLELSFILLLETGLSLVIALPFEQDYCRASGNQAMRRARESGEALGFC
nr:MAG: hypothetical protein AM324_12310 [Candidatus Thorarchaeota archaeon SMTZ1-83]